MSRRATLSDLPTEVVEHALDYLRGNPKTLAACCRVCRHWYPRARYNLLYNVTLCTENAPAFLAAAERDPDAVTLMRELTLFGLWPEPKTPNHDLLTSKLYTMHMQVVDLASYLLPVVTRNAAQSLTELCLTTCTVADGPGFVQFLQSLPQLRHLVATYLLLRSAEDAEVADELAGRLPDLLSLCMSGYRGTQLRLLRTFASATDGLRSLAVLQIKLHAYELAKFGELLEVFSENLRELRLGMEPDDAPLDEASTALSLSPCRKLVAFTLDVRLYYGDPKYVHHLNWVVGLVQSIRADDLRLVKLVVRAHLAAPADLACFDWQGVARVLDEPRFATLRRVVVKVMSRGEVLGDVVEPYVREQMAAVEKRGILRVVVVPRAVMMKGR